MGDSSKRLICVEMQPALQEFWYWGGQVPRETKQVVNVGGFLVDACQQLSGITQEDLGTR